MAGTPKDWANLFSQVVVAIILALAILIAGVMSVKAHCDEDGQCFPFGCCGAADCAAVEKIEMVTEGIEVYYDASKGWAKRPIASKIPMMRVYTKFGAAIVPHDWKWHESSTARMYACIGANDYNRGYLYCTFMPKGI